MIKIYADENERDEQDRYLLDIPGSLKDIERHRDVIAEGLKVVLDVQHEFEVEATLTFDEFWRAIPDMTTIKYLDPEDEPNQ